MNGDGRPDMFVAGYSDPNEPVPNSIAGFPTNLAGVRDLLYLNEGNDGDGRARFREVGVQAGLESAEPRHGLGAVFTDYNGDGRPDLYVANDEDPNQLYVNVPWPGGASADPAGLGFRFEERGAAEGVADPYAGHGHRDEHRRERPPDLFVTNSRNEPSAAFRGLADARSPAFANARPTFDPALGTGFAGWGASWVDLANSGIARPRARRRRDPGDEALERRGAGARAEPGRGRATQPRSANAKDVFGSAGPAPERAWPRRRGREQRRPDGHRDQHDRRQARAPSAHRDERPLARRAAVEVLARRARHRRPPGRAAARRAKCRQAAATSPPRIRACISASAARPRPAW